MCSSAVAPRVLVAFGYALVCGWVSDKAATVAGQRSHRALTENGFRGLPDLGHDWLPDWQGVPIAAHLPDYAAYFFLSLLLVIVVFERRRWAAACKFFYLLGTMLVLRSTTIMVTSPPDPSSICRDYNPDMRWWGNSLFAWDRTCGDMMFSGHTCIMIFCTSLFWEFATFRGAWPLGFFVWAIGGFGVITLTATHYHYTSDVVVATYVGYTMFFLYTLLLRVPPQAHPCGCLVRWLDVDAAVKQAENYERAESEAEIVPALPHARLDRFTIAEPDPTSS